MKGEPVVGRRYVGRDGACPSGVRGELKLVKSAHPHYGAPDDPYVIESSDGSRYGFTREHLTPLVPRKTPPSPPEGWVYYNMSRYMICRDNHTGIEVFSNGQPKYEYERLNVVMPNKCILTCLDRKILSVSDALIVSKFFKRLERWHTQQK